jgi:hypothetical protein
MSQILVSRLDRSKILLFQDLYFIKKRTNVRSGVMEATCTICDKGLDDGVSVTAKKIGQKMKLFCQYHLPRDV